MKPSLVFLVLAGFLFQPLSQASAGSRSVGVNPSTMLIMAMLHQGDHPPTGDERPSDSGALEHMTPAIFVLIACILASIAAWIFVERNADGRLVVPGWMLGIAGLLALLTVFALTDGGHPMGDHPPTGDERPTDVLWVRTHHKWEFWLCMVAVAIPLVVLVIRQFVRWTNDKKHNSYKFLAFFDTAVLAVLLFLLMGASGYYKLCLDSCVMRGSHAGTTYDLPCADNVAFMTFHQVDDRDVDAYKDQFGSLETLPSFQSFNSSVAMHKPIYPAVTKAGPNEIISQPIRFSLDNVKSIQRATLTTRWRQVNANELPGTRVFKPIDIAVDSNVTLEACWSALGASSFRRVNACGAAVGSSGDAVGNIVWDISFQKTFKVPNGKITFITYKFEVQFVDLTTETMEVTFALQDFHLSTKDMPAPVYVQRAMEDVLDIVFIPAKSAGVPGVLSQNFLDEFKSGCGAIIQQGIFSEPSLRFWRKQFNFWINDHPGEARDAGSDEACHIAPRNYVEYLSGTMDFFALLHEQDQWDFKDNCYSLFSAELALVNDHNENSSFLHELGHAAFGLSDEFRGGYNVQATKHLPNNWETRRGARVEAVFRHKEKHDARRLRR